MRQQNMRTTNELRLFFPLKREKEKNGGLKLKRVWKVREKEGS